MAAPVDREQERPRYWTDESWYPPPSDEDSGPVADWWLASDGVWYPPETAPTALGRYYATLLPKSEPPSLVSRLRSVATRLRLPGDGRRRMVAGVGTVAAGVVLVGGFLVMRASPPAASRPRPVDPAIGYLASVHAGQSGWLLKEAPDADTLALGRGVCDKLGTMTPGAVASSMVGAMHGEAFPVGDGALVIRSATRFLCPVHAAAVNAWDGRPASR